MIVFRRWEAAPVNALLEAWGHYLGPQDGPRMVLWYGLFVAGLPIGAAVSASPRGSRCAGEHWERVVECARIVAAPDHRDMTRVVLRCWRKLAAQDWANAYSKRVVMLAAYSDSSRHPGSIYRTDGWTLYDERPRGSGGNHQRDQQRIAMKKLWTWRVDPPVLPRQGTLLSERSATL